MYMNMNGQIILNRDATVLNCKCVYCNTISLYNIYIYICAQSYIIFPILQGVPFLEKKEGEASASNFKL